MWLQARGLSNDVLFIFIGKIEGGKQEKITFFKKTFNRQRRTWQALGGPGPASAKATARPAD
jgi:hypothetical protein